MISRVSFGYETVSQRRRRPLADGPVPGRVNEPGNFYEGWHTESVESDRDR
jgi:hypothetical protein